MSERLKLKNNWPYFLIPTVVLIDQVTKYLAYNFFTLICNQGIAFGLNLPNSSSIYLSTLVLSVLFYILYHSGKQQTFFALTLIFSGGISNLLDRLLFGCVRDFINIGFWLNLPIYLPSLTRWPSFNLADGAITIGAIYLFYSVFFKKN